MKTITVEGYKVIQITDALYEELLDNNYRARCEIVSELVDFDDVTDVSGEGL